MYYSSSSDWMATQHRRVMLFGMSGLGKTHLSNILREAGNWFHYSVDYRIGTRYMGEHIVDNFKAEAMQNPFLAQLLRSDSIYIGSNITFDNLAPLSTYLGKPGSADQGGLAFAEYRRRQEQHRVAEIASLLDAVPFIGRAQAIYDYDHFVCDPGGSICEVVDPEDENDPILTALSQNLLPVWIKGGENHTEALKARFAKAPKPMYFGKAHLKQIWGDFCKENNAKEHEVDPDKFMRWAYTRTLEHRAPIYEAMARNWGVTVMADEVAEIQSQEDFNDIIARALDAARP